MSTNILIIGEGVTDESMLVPLIKKMVLKVGKPNANVRYSGQLDRVSGVDAVLKEEYINKVIKANPMVDVFILCVDGNGQFEKRNQSLEDILTNTRQNLKETQCLIGTIAKCEVETWLLAGYSDLKWDWQTVRNEPDVKETYYQPLAEGLGIWGSFRQGRKHLAQLANYTRIKQLSPDLQN